MLSKNNKILVGCLALLLVMSVGYALFSDTITINGSATAKGEFELTTTCDMDAEALEAAIGHSGELGSVTDATITCNNNVVNASATLDFPGSEKWFRVMVTNTGTIPAKLKKVVGLNDPENMTFEKDNGNFAGIIENCQGDNRVNSACSTLFPGGEELYDYEDGASFDGYWYEEQFDAVLDPGETAYFYIQMMWAPASTTPGEPLTPTLNAQIDWQQVTE